MAPVASVRGDVLMARQLDTNKQTPSPSYRCSVGMKNSVQPRVLCVSVVDEFRATTHHRGTEHTKTAEKSQKIFQVTSESVQISSTTCVKDKLILLPTLR